MNAKQPWSDRFAGAEWRRPQADIAGRVTDELHRRFLLRHVHPHDRVLEVGAAAGRRTIEMVRAGATVVTSDVSDRLLDLNRQYVTAARCEHGVERRLLLDARAVGSLDAGVFDVAVALDGVLSYVGDDAEAVFAALLDAVRPGGVVVASVLRVEDIPVVSLPPVTAIGFGGSSVQHPAIAGAAPVGAAAAPPVRLFAWVDVRRLVEDAGAELVATSASNWLSSGEQDRLRALADNPAAWDAFLAWEERVCSEEGGYDRGTHVLFAARRPG